MLQRENVSFEIWSMIKIVIFNFDFKWPKIISVN